MHRAGHGTVRFDAILMDLQMPEMDGYEATRVIRNHLNNPTLPIIAMTAHALHSERQNCLDAGMNDYVSKPVEPEKLFATLTRWIKAQATPSSPISIPPQSVGAELQLPESLPGIDVADALKRLMDNRQLFVELVNQFSQEHGNVVIQIRAALERNDKRLAHRLAHTVKGVAANLSMPSVSSSARDLESAIQRGDQALIAPAMEKLDDAIKLIIEATAILAKVTTLPGDQPTIMPSPLLDPVALTPMFTELDSLLKRHSANARKQFSMLKEQLNSANGEIPALLVQLDLCLKQLDFKQARKHLGVLARTLDVLIS